MNLHQAVVFAILMENNQGVVAKAPSYVLEKLSSCSTSSSPEALLDENNRAKFEEWKRTWLKGSDE